ncbi:MAG: rhodanese-like domain-containing protein [Planctomycetota bacterium]
MMTRVITLSLVTLGALVPVVKSKDLGILGTEQDSPPAVEPPVIIESTAIVEAPAIVENPSIDFNGFISLTTNLRELREARRVNVEDFNRMAQEPNTIILDTRSKSAFDSVHLANAVHLNFSDFTDAKLREVIPSKQTRVLIYCNNNFVDEEKEIVPDLGKEEDDEVIAGFTDKSPALALNIPTFVNLHGYGYENVYELADRLSVFDPRISLVGNSVVDKLRQ